MGRKVKYSNVSRDDQSATIRRDIDLLAMARVVAKVTHSHCSGLPLQAELKEAAFKLIFLDIGLMNAPVWLQLADHQSADRVGTDQRRPGGGSSSSASTCSISLPNGQTGN